MRHPPSLSEAEIRTQYLVISPALMRTFLDAEFIAYVDEERRITEANGGALDLIGWADGTTILWTRPTPSTPIDVEDLVSHYKAAKLAYNIVESGARHHGR